MALLVRGAGARATFSGEAGGHRWQRVPPNDRRGRVQTSTVTVAVLDPDDRRRRPLDLREVDIAKSLGTGPGGQHRNKTESCVTATHRPTGLSVRVDMRSQHQSLATALAVLGARLEAAAEQEAATQRNAHRRSQVGAGMRGDKVRTYREQDGKIVDHRDERTQPLTRWLRGDWD